MLNMQIAFSLLPKQSLQKESNKGFFWRVTVAFESVITSVTKSELAFFKKLLKGGFLSHEFWMS